MSKFKKQVLGCSNRCKKSGYDLFYIVNYLGNVLRKMRLDIRVERRCISKTRPV